MATEKKKMGSYGGMIAGFLAFIGLGFLGYYLYRRMQFRFNDASNSDWAGPQYDWMKGQSVPQEFKTGKQILQLNSPSLFKVGDKVKVTYDDQRAGGSGGTYEVLHIINRKAIIISQSASPAGGPWSGTVQLV